MKFVQVKSESYFSPEAELIVLNDAAFLMADSFGDGTIEDNWNDLGEF